MKPITVLYTVLLTLLPCVGTATIAAPSNPDNAHAPVTMPITTKVARGLSGLYIDSKYLTGVPFGSHSHWLQAWRGWQQAVPATTFLNGLAINMDTSNESNDELMCRHLAQNGIRHGRVEIGWGSLGWDGELSAGTRQRFPRLLQAMQKYQIRPLILLNAHQGVPGPVQFFDRKLAAAAHKGDREVLLDDASGLTIGYSGLRDISDYWASEFLITGIAGNRVSLSKPLPKDIGEAGAVVKMSTLKYRPFGPPDTPEYTATLNGWKDYVRKVTALVTQILSTQNAADKGYDIEVWNELSFGSNFLTINRYYEPKFADYDENKIWGRVVQATVDVVEEHPQDFRGVVICDGFPNTIPWPASSSEPARVGALSRHPYAGAKTYPKDEQGQSTFNALGVREERPPFVPNYSIGSFPEYHATWLQTESVMRDSAPMETEIYGVRHGRNARVVAGKVAPVEVWFTEVGFAPEENGITDRQAALDLKAKTTARYYCFFLNKGLSRLYLYAANARDTWLGIVQDNFIEYSRKNTAYPTDDRAFTSPSLRTLSRIQSKMRDGLDAKLTATRDLKIETISDTHDHFIFAGDDTPAHPNLFHREVFAWLPYQVNARKWVVPYYVMTRDMTKALPPEKYTVRFSGARPRKISAYDPINDRAVPLKVLSKGAATTVELMATDYPYLLIIEER